MTNIKSARLISQKKERLFYAPGIFGPNKRKTVLWLSSARMFLADACWGFLFIGKAGLSKIVLGGAVLFLAFTFMGCDLKPCFAFTDIQIANAIYKAEGGANTHHPYGILKHYQHTTAKQACLNMIASAKRRYEKTTKTIDFISFLGKTYCPVGCNNDNGTNGFWIKNVNYFLERG